MAISNFVPEVWSNLILAHLRNVLVFAQDGVINRNYEGEISKAGDTVHITSFTYPSVRSYTKDSDITVDVLTDSEAGPLVVDQKDYFAFEVDDVDKRQALPGFVGEATSGAAYNLAAKVDTYVSGLMVAGANSNLGSVTVDSTTPEGAYELLLKLRTALGRKSVPTTGRFVIVPPELYSVLLRDNRFVRVNEAGTDAGLRNGIVGRAAGFDVIESNTDPDAGTASSTSPSGQVTTGPFSVVAGHSIATTFAQQIASTEAYRKEKGFADGVKGLHLYGGKVIKGDALAKASVDVVIAP